MPAMHTETQPSNRELRDALHRCRVLKSRASLSSLRGYRARRTTWFGADELALRAEIDAMLDGRDEK